MGGPKTVKRPSGTGKGSIATKEGLRLGLFPRLESTEYRDFRNKCAHTSWLPRLQSRSGTFLAKFERSPADRWEKLQDC